MKHLLLYALFVYIGIGCCRDTALAPTRMQWLRLRGTKLWVTIVPYWRLTLRLKRSSYPSTGGAR